jgi:hypothetical protein
MTSYGPESDDVLAEMREAGLHGDAAARALADPVRYELPDADELDSLMLLVLERDAFPQRMGRVAATYADVLFGWRAMNAAVRELASDSTRAELPADYRARLEGIAADLMRGGRALEALMLARLLLAAVSKAYGQGSTEWIDSAACFLQTLSAVRPGTRELLQWGVAEEAGALLDPLLSAAREKAAPRDLQRVISIVGQHLWHRGDDEHGGQEDPAALQRAEELISEVASLREGAERGRSLASLAQIRAKLHERGKATSESVAYAAREAVRLVDREDRPQQWLTAKHLARRHAPTYTPPEPITTQTLQTIRERHGENIAQGCLCLEAYDLADRGLARDAQTLLTDAWAVLHVERHEDEVVTERLLRAGAHTLGRGWLACEDIDPRAADRLARRTRWQREPRRLANRIHIAMHQSGPIEPGSWIVSEGPRLVSERPASPEQEWMLYALAVIHTRQLHTDYRDSVFKFRCGLLAAVAVARLGLQSVAIECLGVALSVAKALAGTAARVRGEAAVYQARHEIEGVLDACLHEAANLDADLGDPGREWLLEVGRALSAPARASATAHPLTAIAHSLAFKGALTSELARKPPVWVELPTFRQTEEEIAHLEAAELQAAGSEQLPTELAEEMRRCAWLHGAERQSGASVRQRRRNLQARYDDTITRALAFCRGAFGYGLHEIPGGRLAERLGSRSVLIDLYLGRDQGGAYATHATVLAPGRTMREYLVRHQMQVATPMPDPTDPDGWLLLDGLAELVSLVRLAVQEAPGGRPVSRAGAAALQAAAHNVLGDLVGDLDELRSEGRDHLVFCPHGPLSYLQFALLDVGGKPLGQDWTVTTVPSLGVLLTDPSSTSDSEKTLGVIASASGGAPYGLHVEPRLSEQAQQIRREVPGATVLDGGEATPQAACALLASSRYAHLAAHGSVLEQVPAFHCLYLDTDGESDGRLYAHQLMRGDLRSLELVTLCACETALGRFDPAGNTRGLPQALLVAGVRTVVATLWPVRAKPALEFFGHLHRSLHQGADKLTAFRSAQQDAMARFPRYADWGAFTYIGAWN